MQKQRNGRFLHVENIILIFFRINELTPEDILPNSIFTPRTPIVEVETSQEIEEYQITSSTKFTKNPLAMLIEVPSKGIADGKN